MIFKKASFNMKWVLTFKDADTFANHNANKSLWPELTEEQRIEHLKTFYNLATNANTGRDVTGNAENKSESFVSGSDGGNGTGGAGSATPTTDIGSAQ